MEESIDLEELKKLAEEGNIDAKIEYATECIENAIDINENLAQLEHFASENNTRALINLGFVYSLGVIKTHDDGTNEQIIEIDNEKAEPYFIKAAELGSHYAKIIVGQHKYMKCQLWYAKKDESSPSEDIVVPTPDDFVSAVNLLTAGLEGDEELDCDLDYLYKIGVQSLAALYSMKCDINPIYNEKKAANWRKKK